jgi:predicted AAA+ superfamily ATPase
MQSHLKESIAGRKIERVIYPLTFSEWLTQFEPEVQTIPSFESQLGVDAQEEIRRRLPSSSGLGDARAGTSRIGDG